MGRATRREAREVVQGRGGRETGRRGRLAVADLTEEPREDVRMMSHMGTEEARARAGETGGAGRDCMWGERGALRGTVAA